MDQNPNEQQPQTQPVEPITANSGQPPVPTPGAPAPAAPGENPGQVFGILAIIAPFVGFSIVGIVLGIIARNKSKNAGYPTTLGTVGLVISIVVTILATLWLILMVILAMAGIQEKLEESQSKPEATSSSLQTELFQ